MSVVKRDPAEQLGLLLLAQLAALHRPGGGVLDVLRGRGPALSSVSSTPTTV